MHPKDSELLDDCQSEAACCAAALLPPLLLPLLSLPPLLFAFAFVAIAFACHRFCVPLSLALCYRLHTCQIPQLCCEWKSS